MSESVVFTNELPIFPLAVIGVLPLVSLGSVGYERNGQLLVLDRVFAEVWIVN